MEETDTLLGVEINRVKVGGICKSQHSVYPLIIN